MLALSAFLALTLNWSAPHTASPTRFGDRGHNVVCEIAFQLLDPDERAEIARLTRLYRPPDGPGYSRFADACTFPDRARRRAKSGARAWRFFNQFNRWHFLNVPRSTHTVEASDCARDCVLHGIEYHRTRAANSNLEDWKRAEALFFLGHWVGDVHQPLHVSFHDDNGGNEVEVSGGYYGYADNLHAVWDTGILYRLFAGRNWDDYARSLAQNITPSDNSTWQAASPLAWAQESYDIVVRSEVDYCEWVVDSDGGDLCAPEWHTRTPNSSYQSQFADVVELRLKQAGVRLAMLLKAAL